MHHNIVTISGCSVVLGGRMALTGINFSIAPGDRLALLGGNGAGKTTLLRLIRGELHPAQGMGGVRAYKLAGPGGTSPLAARRSMSLISAEAQDAWVRLGLAVNGMQMVLSGFSDSLYPPSRTTDEQRDAALAALRSLGAEALAGKRLDVMSRGQTRQVLLARALATKPQVLLLDEFLDGLDTRAANAALEILEDLTRNGVAMVLTTHRPARLPGFINKAALMSGGRIVKTGPPASLTPAGQNAPAFDKIHAPVRQGGAPDFLVRIQNASVRRKGVDVLKNVDLAIRPGEHLAVLGPNGSGKSTLLLLMMAALRPMTGGLVQWFGQKDPVDVFEIRKRIGYVAPEMQATYSYDVSALELVLSGFDASIGLYREPGEPELGRARDLMAMAGLAGIESQRIRSLSYGQLRRLLVARALAPEPELLLLDEAASGLDPAARAGLLEVLERAAASGVSLVMATHHKDDLPSCVNRAITIKDGFVRPHQEKSA